MKITYINHSCFTLEYENAIMLFDYFKGDFPLFDEEKQLYVFASHRHGDHFDPCIFELFDRYKNINYILSDDIRLSDKYLFQKGIPHIIKEKINFISPNKIINLECGKDLLKIEALASTDEGVAFLINYCDKTIYHAGDLNWWAWKEEDDSYNKSMEERYKKEINKLKNVFIDIAFLPVDLRQEEWYSQGFNYFLSQTNTQKAFPMHFWEDFSVMEKIKDFSRDKKYKDNIVYIRHEGEVFFK